MNHAIKLASKALGETSPNPCVGCVIVDKEGNIVGEGYHHKAGQSHAEVLALKEAGDKANGSTAYVSLEPCNHYGRTPPCTLALINNGISRVVVGMVDPDPRVSGTGLTFLKDRGIKVDLFQGGMGELNDKCESLNLPFIFRVLNKRPYSVVVWDHLQLSDSNNDITRLLHFLPEIDTIVFKIDDLIANPNNVFKTIPKHISIVILGMECANSSINEALQRCYLEDDMISRRWYIFVDRDNNLISNRINLQVIAIDYPHQSEREKGAGYSLTNLLTNDLLHKVASLGSNAVLLMANGFDEVCVLRQNGFMQKLILMSKLEDSMSDVAMKSSYEMADGIVNNILNDDKSTKPVIGKVHDIDKDKRILLLSYQLWTRKQ